MKPSLLPKRGCLFPNTQKFSPSEQNLFPQQLVNFDKSFRGIEIDINIGGKEKKQSCGDRFIPFGVSQKAYNLMNVDSSKKETTLVKKTSTEFYQEYLCSHILNVENAEDEKINKVMNYKKRNEVSNKQNFNSILRSQSKKITSKERKIKKHSYKMLEAHSLQDDFYLNLLDWSSSNTIAAGLDTVVVLWSGCSSKITHLYETEDPTDYICSVSFATNNPNHLAVGNSKGQIKIFDIQKEVELTTLFGHEGRIGSLNWSSSGSILASGARDGTVAVWDVKRNKAIQKYQAHGQEICGLKWSNDGSYIASGGNDNKLVIYSNKAGKELVKFHEHKAAVKAIGWAPESSGIIASGGGTADRHIRFFSTQSLTQVHNIDTGSQVCNLAFSKISNQMVSTHGYSLNQINVWSVNPSAAKIEPSKIATLTGHTYRVLYLASSPDGSSILTGAGDETLRFWNVFDKEGVNKTQILSFSADLR